MADQPVQALAAVDCCPPMEPCAPCDVLTTSYRLPFKATVVNEGQTFVVPVEVTLRFELRRCPGTLGLGDLAYTTTLLPGEKVRLFTSDRHSRFSFDASSSLAYRHETTTEESYFMAGMAHAVSSLDVNDTVNRSSTFSESAVSGGGGAGLDLGFFEIGGSVAASSYDAQSTSKFARNFSQHASSSSSHWETATRAASSVSVGEVQTRNHSEGQSEDHFESASRVFANPNRCRALTFLFYRLVKCQTLSLALVSIERRVVDPAAPTGVRLRATPPAGSVPVVPQAVAAASGETRLAAERAGRTSAQERLKYDMGGDTPGTGVDLNAEPYPVAVRQAALRIVDRQLVADGLLDRVDGEVSPEAQERYGWERALSLPTPGLIVKGCLDDCDVCEPELHEEIVLDLRRKELENMLLARKIELLEQAQEYRCCPVPVPEG